MPVLRIRDREPDEGTGASSSLWVAIMLTLSFGVLVTVLAGSFIVQSIVQTGRESLDNRTWVFAQLEVDYLRFETRLHRAINADRLTPDIMDRVMTSFDIYYSRVETVDAGKRFFNEDTPGTAKIHDSISRVVQHRDALATMLDQLGTPRRDDLEDILDHSEEVIPTLRDVTTNALKQLTSQYSAMRQSEESAIKRFMALSTIEALVLLAITMLAIRLAMRLRMRAKAMKRLRDSFRGIVEASLDGVVLLSVEGRILGYNTAAAKIFDCQDQDVVGQTLQDVALPRLRQTAFKSDPTAFMNEAFDILAIRRRLRTQLKTCRGQMFRAEVALARHEDAIGRSIIIAFVRDLEDTIAQENKLKQARDKALQAMSAQERFLNLMSHEMKTPLHGVIASLDLLQDYDWTSDDLENLQIARDSAAAALAQVEDVLAISSNDAGTRDTTPFEPFDPMEIVKLIVGQARLKARNKDVTVAYRITGDDGDSGISGRKEAFRRAVANLVDNAVKFTEHGSINIHLVYWQDAASDRRLTVKVSDTGPGIAPAVQEIAFADFQTISKGAALKHVGSGLGLGIAKRAVDRMGGILHLDSCENEGSHFSFDIAAPFVSKPKLASVERPATKQLASPDDIQVFPRALVVDDNAANRILMQKMLERLGYTVQCAENGEQAVEIADMWRFTLILMDIRMPGMDGFEATMAIRSGSSSQDALILGVTANLASQDAECFTASGMQEMLAKPLTIGQLKEKISHHVNGPKQDASARPPVVEAVDVEEEFVISATSGNLSYISETMELDELEAWLQACLDEIRQALDAAARDRPGSIQAVHKAAGTAAVIGLPRLQSALNQMEAAQADADPFASALLEASDVFRKIRLDLSGA